MGKHTSITHQGYWLLGQLWSIPIMCRNKPMHLSLATKECAGPAGNRAGGKERDVCAPGPPPGLPSTPTGERDFGFFLSSHLPLPSSVPHPAPSLPSVNL